MKKRYLILAGVLAAVLMAAGCGAKEEDKTEQEVQITVTPTAAAEEGALVEMQKNTDDNIKNVIGIKSEKTSKIILVNETGSDIARLYIRPHTDDEEEWGTELIQNMFTLKNKDKALYYFDASQKDENGNTATSYDIRIVYVDTDRSECYFRSIPLQKITQITLRMDGNGDSSIPYAVYRTSDSQKETSTLQEVRQRLGLDYEEEEEDTETDKQDENQDTPAPTQKPDNDEPTPTQPAENGGGSNNGQGGESGGEVREDGAAVAEQYIGRSLSDLVAVIGEASGSDYEDEPETGETGYHYYDTFTVSTTVDEGGNEVVAGVW